MIFGKRKKADRTVGIAIGITTFEQRFDAYFTPLVTRIRQYDADTVIVVAVNGENGRPFGEDYRRRLLDFVSRQPGVFPVIYPVFRGLSKLWNTILIHAPSDYVLMLNDDVMIDRADFMARVEKKLLRNGYGSFLINNSWSHFVASKKEIADLGYFDERLLGIGEEDGDMTWRFIQRHGRPVPSFSIPGFVNYSEDTMGEKPANVACRKGSKYSVFNRRFMFETKYRVDENGIRGMFDQPVVMQDAGPVQHPNEGYFMANRHRLTDRGGTED